ncbi:MAG: response regulator transcription factor [Defluviitaleaceae bacterium]|nr:response regulator transcription factor [Defluviitaleaceae bacterium]
MSKIFLVEDDPDIRETVLYALQSSGFDAFGFENAKPFFHSLEKETTLPALIILDIMLPGDDGLSILKKLRQSHRYQALPIIMLTAKSSEIDKVKGLDSGADDYLTKPFSVMELTSRIKALLRRSSSLPAKQESIAYQNIKLDHLRRKVLVDDTAITLTFKEYELLHYLMVNAGMVLQRDKILEVIWGYDFEGESRTLDMHIKSLRKKLGPASEHIKTIRNVGYKLGE